jgi:hypothetical protein
VADVVIEALRRLFVLRKYNKIGVSITSSATFVNSWVTRHAQTASRLQSQSSLAMLSHHDSSLDDGLQGEVAMSTVIDCPYRDHFDRHSDRHQLWDRWERANLFEPSLDLPAQGVSQRQAAKQLQGPPTTLQAWQSWRDTLDICPHVAQFFQSGPGWALHHRLV